MTMGECFADGWLMRRTVVKETDPSFHRSRKDLFFDKVTPQSKEPSIQLCNTQASWKTIFLLVTPQKRHRGFTQKIFVGNSFSNLCPLYLTQVFQIQQRNLLCAKWQKQIKATNRFGLILLKRKQNKKKTTKQIKLAQLQFSLHKEPLVQLLNALLHCLLPPHSLNTSGISHLHVWIKRWNHKTCKRVWEYNLDSTQTTDHW